MYSQLQVENNYVEKRMSLPIHFYVFVLICIVDWTKKSCCFTLSILLSEICVVVIVCCGFNFLPVLTAVRASELNGKNFVQIATALNWFIIKHSFSSFEFSFVVVVVIVDITKLHQHHKYLFRTEWKTRNLSANDACDRFYWSCMAMCVLSAQNFFLNWSRNGRIRLLNRADIVVAVVRFCREI